MGSWWGMLPLRPVLLKVAEGRTVIPAPPSLRFHHSEILDAPEWAHHHFAPLLTQALGAAVSEKGFTTSESGPKYTRSSFPFPLRFWLSIAKANLTILRNVKIDGGFPPCALYKRDNEDDLRIKTALMEERGRPGSIILWVAERALPLYSVSILLEWMVPYKDRRLAPGPGFPPVCLTHPSLLAVPGSVHIYRANRSHRNMRVFLSYTCNH